MLQASYFRRKSEASEVVLDTVALNFFSDFFMEKKYVEFPKKEF